MTHLLGIFPLQENYGDISDRLLLRDRLKCNSFDWYLKNIYPELHVPEDRAGWHGAVSFYPKHLNMFFCNVNLCKPQFGWALDRASILKILLKGKKLGFKKVQFGTARLLLQRHQDCSLFTEILG